jgi:hypothetical protein
MYIPGEILLGYSVTASNLVVSGPPICQLVWFEARNIERL